jgi:hypothetical protein
MVGARGPKPGHWRVDYRGADDLLALGFAGGVTKLRTRQ